MRSNKSKIGLSALIDKLITGRFMNTCLILTLSYFVYVIFFSKELIFTKFLYSLIAILLLSLLLDIKPIQNFLVNNIIKRINQRHWLNYREGQKLIIKIFILLTILFVPLLCIVSVELALGFFIRIFLLLLLFTGILFLELFSNLKNALNKEPLLESIFNKSDVKNGYLPYFILIDKVFLPANKSNPVKNKFHKLIEETTGGRFGTIKNDKNDFGDTLIDKDIVKLIIETFNNKGSKPIIKHKQYDQLADSLIEQFNLFNLSIPEKRMTEFKILSLLYFYFKFDDRVIPIIPEGIDDEIVKIRLSKKLKQYI